METITLRVGQNPRSFRVVPNKGDVTVEDVTRSISGGVDGDGFVGLSQYVSEPGNPLAVTLPVIAPHPAGTTHATTPTHLVGSFDSATEPGEVQTVPFDVAILVLPENADAATIEEIV